MTQHFTSLAIRRLFATAVLVGASAVTACGDSSWLRFGKDDDESTAMAPSQPPHAVPPQLEDLPADLEPVANLEEMIQRLALKPYHARGFRGQNLTIAVLDNGFTGLNHSVGKRLPPDTKLMPSPRPEMQDTSHGLKLAELAYALATGSVRYEPSRPGPRILLYNSNGFTNFTAAIDSVITEKADIVLYAQVWEYGGNFDGGGFINREVRRATSQGVLWVNAAGNLGQATYHGPIRLLSSTLTSSTATSSAATTVTRELALPHQGRYVRFTVPQDQTPVKIVLSWNDFDDTKDYHTHQDLDLILEAADGRELAVSRLTQDGQEVSLEEAKPGEPQRSAHAREIIQTMLDTGSYKLRVEANSQNFDVTSRLRLTVDGLNVRMLDRATDDTVLIPADSTAVLTVGASDVDFSAVASSTLRSKPEVFLPSEVRFEGGQTVRGTSTATALAVGALAVYKSAWGKLSLSGVLQEIESGRLATRDRFLCASAAAATGQDPCARAPLLRLRGL